jgi:putative acetyltransferase
MLPMALQIAQAISAEDFATARSLIEEYAASLGVDLSFQDFAHEIDSLTTEYSPPRGRLLLARIEGLAIGCGALRPFDESICEMKRLYVIPARRRTGAGLMLAQKLISEARAIGYRAMRLDTLPGMEKAQQLYRSLGFHEIPAYRYNPIAGTQFLELNLMEE